MTEEILCAGTHMADGGRGAVYVYRYDACLPGWGYEAKLTAEGAEAMDRLGLSVSASGDTILAAMHGRNNAAARGVVFVHRPRGSPAWAQEAVLAPEGTERDESTPRCNSSSLPEKVDLNDKQGSHEELG